MALGKVRALIKRPWVWGLLLALALAGCDASNKPQTKVSSAKAATPPQSKGRDPVLEGIGEHYDLAKYEACKAKEPRDLSCERFRLKRTPAPETWPYHDTPPIKWPEAPAETVYRPGMTPIDYWRALCKAEAGEFIYRTVEGEEAIYQIRPRMAENNYAYGDRYVMEDPYGYTRGERGSIDAIPFGMLGPVQTSRNGGPRYQIFETPFLVNDRGELLKQYRDPSLFQPVPPGAKFQRFYGYANDFRSLKMEYVSELKSRYGFTWRAIRRPFDRETGVAGGELAVVDLKTGEILGLRRGFVLGTTVPGGPVNWFSPNACPEYALMPGVGQIRKRNKDVDFTSWFVTKVVVPPHQFID